MVRRGQGKMFFSADTTKWFLIGSNRRHNRSLNTTMEMMNSYQYAYIDKASDISRSTYATLNIKTMKKLTPQQEALLDADTKTLLQAGFLKDDLTPSNEGLDASEEILFETNKAALVVKAAAIIEAAKTAK